MNIYKKNIYIYALFLTYFLFPEYFSLNADIADIIGNRDYQLA